MTTYHHDYVPSRRSYIPEKVLGNTTFESNIQGNVVTNGSRDHKSIDGWTPAGGSQVIESKSFNDLRSGNSVDSNGSRYGRYVELNDVHYWGYEDARGITRTFDTQRGKEHTISFDYTGRSGYGSDVNAFKIMVDGREAGCFTDDAKYNSRYNSNVWHEGEVTFTADWDGKSEITFIEDSNNDQYYGRGMFVDNVKVVQDGYHVRRPYPFPGDPTSSSANTTNTINQNSNNTTTIANTYNTTYNLANTVTIEGNYYANPDEFKHDSLTGTDANNELVGARGADTLIGGGGDDFLRGSQGMDIIDGGEGNDALFGGIGHNRINASIGSDRVSIAVDQTINKAFGHRGNANADAIRMNDQTKLMMFGAEKSQLLFEYVDTDWAKRTIGLTDDGLLSAGQQTIGIKVGNSYEAFVQGTTLASISSQTDASTVLPNI